MSTLDIKEFAISRLGNDFKFRPGQLEAVESILDAFYTGENNVFLLDAPVGAGKSIIALLVSDIISQSKLNGYILASDLSLFDQYKKDIDLYFPTIKSVKGADNYTCDVNLASYNYGDCKLKNYSTDQIVKLPCYSTCGYISDRTQAIKANTSLVTYAFGLIQRNFIAPKLEAIGRIPPFGKRDFVICDEAHNINKIVQDHFSPKIDKFTSDKLEKFRSLLQKYGLNLPKYRKEDLRILFANIYNEKTPSNTLKLLNEFHKVLIDYNSKGTEVKVVVANQMQHSKTLDTDLKQALNLFDYISDLTNKFADYIKIIHKAGIDQMIKNEQLNNAIVFNCVDESYLMNKHFHNQFGFKLFMTATMGDPQEFMKNLGITSANYHKIENSFDFTKSPIYFYGGNKMTYSEKDKSLPKITKIIETILLDHYNDRGIIHSGSYENSKRIHEGLSEHLKKRVLIYTDSQEKTNLLKQFLDTKNAVLIGPSLLEGLDLAGDKSRFQIFAKIPFPNISDKFIAAKMQKVPGWYDWQAISNILQGIGRSVRNEKDWAITYFLDESFRDLLKRKRNHFSDEIKQRIIIKN